MNTLYITNTGRIMITENGDAKPYNASRVAIDDLLHIKEDTKIVYNKNNKSNTIDAKAGDIVVTFYEGEFPTPVIVVKSDDWNKNLNEYEACEQKRKEEWADMNKECCAKNCCAANSHC